MLKKLFTNVLYTGSLIAVFVFGYWFGQSTWAPFQVGAVPSPASSETQEKFTTFWEIWRLVNNDFLDQEKINDDQLIEGAINGMLDTLGDPHTRYMSPEAQSNAIESMNGEFQGIGAEVTSEDGNITIISPFEGSPAAEAGLKPGDIIREADGVPLTDMDVVDAAALVRGPAGSQVILLIERNGEQFEQPIIRGVIKLSSVRGEMREDQIAYIRLNRFADNSATELSDLLDELLAQNPIGLILDLRGNPGGSLTTSVDIADLFLDKGTILFEQFGNGRLHEYTAETGDAGESIPMVILIDEGSASASELIAGSFQDRGRAIIIGQTSYGKGTVQTWRELSNGGGLRLTIARWLTPDKRWIHEEGVTPDIDVPLPEEFQFGDPDVQLDRAADELLKGN